MVSVEDDTVKLVVGVVIVVVHQEGKINWIRTSNRTRLRLSTVEILVGLMNPRTPFSGAKRQEFDPQGPMASVVSRRL